jgi:Na+-transporting NADH:ubiquinone oxidoreductase subunit E
VAVTFVTVCTAVINYFIYYGVLISTEKAAELGRAAPLIPADLTYLRFLIFIMLIAGFVQLVEMVIERFSPVLYYNLGIYLPLITVNCAILGVSELMINPDYKFGLLMTAGYALGSGLGYLLAICLMAGIRLRLEHADIPKPLQGLGIAVIITGLMAMAFMGFTGVVDL